MNDQTTADIAVEWDALSAKEWSSLLAKAPIATFQQSYGFGEVIRAHRGGIFRVQLLADGKTVGLAQIHTRRLAGLATLATLMLGPVWLADHVPVDIKAALYSQLKKTLPVKGVHAFVVMPWEGDEGPASLGLKQVVTPYHTALINLEPTEDDLLAGLDRSWRNKLRGAQKSSVRISPLGRTEQQYGWLLQKEREQQKRIGYRAMPVGLVPAWAEQTGQQALYGWEAKMGDERLGGILCLRHGTTATYHIGWASEAGKKAKVMNLLLWTAMTALKKKGVRILDLGGLDTDHGPGIATFKLASGARLVSQPGTFLLRAGWR
ncbi:lipid II:glycine glycyltransferase FemX [Parvularcula sp. LCG005]|uniref:lipid II:glycine glycyltransferase FemX n=1 Tax=Parvularcula sp. LCG005 TaxID=3078805 RepID=UPI002943231E|nr:GNAT family N-acetyltransferase [Parvularcula sp. LCG005]WOI54588.1 GNAT family N-acetyltransferase [Parvularcula sp. LCG005]